MNDNMVTLIQIGLKMPGSDARFSELAGAVTELVVNHRWGFAIGSQSGGGGPDFDACSNCGGLFGFALWSGYLCLVAHTGENGRGMNLWVETNIPFPDCEVPRPDEHLLQSARDALRRRQGIFDGCSERVLELVERIAKMTFDLAKGTQWSPWLCYSSRSAAQDAHGVA